MNSYRYRTVGSYDNQCGRILLPYSSTVSVQLYGTSRWSEHTMNSTVGFLEHSVSIVPECGLGAVGAGRERGVVECARTSSLDA
eukprot:COSAG02_NODE_15465_length_1168_cov_2.352666_1_plen_84_part_00